MKNNFYIFCPKSRFLYDNREKYFNFANFFANNIAIVIAALIVLSAGGFAIFWFVIKKKTLDELLEFARELVEKIKNIFNKENK